jgi:hypothetical protein
MENKKKSKIKYLLILINIKNINLIFQKLIFIF